MNKTSNNYFEFIKKKFIIGNINLLILKLNSYQISKPIQ